jgi:hypothetical protein
MDANFSRLRVRFESAAVTKSLAVVTLAGGAALGLAACGGGKTETKTVTTAQKAPNPYVPVDPVAEILKLQEGKYSLAGGKYVARYVAKEHPGKQRYNLWGYMLACNSLGDLFQYQITRRADTTKDHSITKDAYQTVTTMDEFPDHSICADRQVMADEVPGLSKPGGVIN